ncbi:MAG: hypothetical protein AAF666_06615 [Pseudomonadota bacterium]
MTEETATEATETEMAEPYGAVAIIGWGSLIWDLELLAPHVRQPWMHRAGPVLPMEFTRISPKRMGALAVCLDQTHGVTCDTCVIQSTRGDLMEAREDLARRERTPAGNIGAVCTKTHFSAGRPQIAWLVMQWCMHSPYAGAVWTDIGPNFAQSQGEEFSVAGGLAYLKSLKGESLDSAVRYIKLAPVSTDTHLRLALRDDPWWQDQCERLGLS